MAVSQLHSALLESQTFDEGFHLTAGFSYWKTGDFRLNREHPPLGKLLASAPLLATSAELDTSLRAWKEADLIELFGYFVYRNRLDPDRMLLLARLPMIGVSLLLGLAIALYARAHHGPLAGLAALGFYATDPNFIAHGHYVTSDVLAALCVFLAGVVWLRSLDQNRWPHWALAGLALGLALVAKFSTLFLFPVHLVTATWKRKLRFDPAAVCLAMALVIVAAVYWPETRRWKQLDPFANHIYDNPVLEQVARDYRLRNHSYLNGLLQLWEHDQSGHQTYLNGVVAERGSWLYFPVAFAVKTPTALLLACLAGALLWWRRIPALALYPIVYALLAFSSSLNIGLRHLLPVYPFLFVLAGIVCAHRRWLLVLAGAAQLFEAGRAHPDHLAFFNTLAGGPSRGHRYLLDSNLDWGQDAKKLGRWMRARNVDEMCVSYFGMASLDYYGIRQIPLLNIPESDRARLDCYAAVSLTNLYDVYLPPGTHAWLRRLQPVDRAGRSIWIYDLRRGQRSPAVQRHRYE
jgi:hypothetical protein